MTLKDKIIKLAVKFAKRAKQLECETGTKESVIKVDSPVQMEIKITNYFTLGKTAIYIDIERPAKP